MSDLNVWIFIYCLKFFKNNLFIVHWGPLDTLYRCELLSKLQVSCHPQETPGQLSQVGSWCVTVVGWPYIASKPPVLCPEPPIQQR